MRYVSIISARVGVRKLAPPEVTRPSPVDTPSRAEKLGSTMLVWKSGRCRERVGYTASVDAYKALRIQRGECAYVVHARVDLCCTCRLPECQLSPARKGFLTKD